MLKNRSIRYYSLAVLAMLGIVIGIPSWAEAETNEDFEVLDSGPIHEAFAETALLDPEPGMTAPSAPPDMIEEIPPGERPEGNVHWIPGYWAWDDEYNDFIWISGIWRVPPPGRQWVPGYWSPIPDGYQWISGYWAEIDASEMRYLPEPPETVEVGPSSNLPSPDHIWITGSWQWYGGHYAWRPGYWAVAHPDWIWVPAHYVWTPRGYIFVSGYWDHLIARRGVLYAPVHFRPRVHLGMHFSFSPGFIVRLNLFDDALFLRPRYSHYYYGNYYAPRHYQRGIYPWFSVRHKRVVYDPIYVHQRWKHRHDHEWEKHLQNRFDERRKHESIAPHRSYDRRNGPIERAYKRPDYIVSRLRSGNNSDVHRFRPVSERERKEYIQKGKEVRIYRQERRDRETDRRSFRDQQGASITEAYKERFSRSPILDRSDRKSGDRKAPPSRYREPKPNSRFEPSERIKDSSRPRDRSRFENSDRNRQPITNTRDTGDITEIPSRSGRSFDDRTRPAERPGGTENNTRNSDDGKKQNREETPVIKKSQKTDRPTDVRREDRTIRYGNPEDNTRRSGSRQYRTTEKNREASVMEGSRRSDRPSDGGRENRSFRKRNPENDTGKPGSDHSRISETARETPPAERPQRSFRQKSVPREAPDTGYKNPEGPERRTGRRVQRTASDHRETPAIENTRESGRQPDVRRESRPERKNDHNRGSERREKPPEVREEKPVAAEEVKEAVQPPQ